MKCAVCDFEVEENEINCPRCGAEVEEPPLLPAIKDFAIRTLKMVDKRARIGAGVLVVAVLVFFAYRAFPGTGSVSGQVTWRDTVGTFPVVGARVLIVQNGVITIEKVTDDRGRFALDVPAGDVEVVVADLNSVKTGSQSDYTVTDRVWLSRFWRKPLSVARGSELDLSFTNQDVSAPDIKYFSTGQLKDYRNRQGWFAKGPFTEKQISEVLKKSEATK